MPSGSDHAWNAQGELNAINRDEYPQHIRDLIDDYVEAVEDLAVEMEIAEK